MNIFNASIELKWEWNQMTALVTLANVNIPKIPKSMNHMVVYILEIVAE